MFYFCSCFRFGSKIAEQSVANNPRTVPTRTGPARNKLKVHPHNPLPPHAAALPLHSHMPARLPGNRVPAPLPPSPLYHPGPESTVHRHQIVSSCQARLAACRKQTRRRPTSSTVRLSITLTATYKITLIRSLMNTTTIISLIL